MPSKLRRDYLMSMAIQKHTGSADPYSNDFPALTGLRGLAAFWVLSYHAWIIAVPTEITVPLFHIGVIELHPLLASGWAGVQLFFALSAFLLTLPYARYLSGLHSHPPGKVRYFGRRLARVFPAYYLQAAVLLGVALLTGGLRWDEFNGLGYIATMNFLPEPLGYGLQPNLNGVWWTLSVELSFYFCLPAIVWLVIGPHRWIWATVAMGIMMLWRYAVIEYAPPDSQWLWFSQLPGSLDSFVSGMLAAYYFSRYEIADEVDQKSARRWAGPILLASALLILGLIYWLDAIYWTYRTQHVVSYLWTIALSCAYALIIFFAAAGHSVLERLLANKWLVTIGLASYGIYLWHWPMAQWLSRASYYNDTGAYLLIQYWVAMGVLSVIVGWISWRWLEQPIIQVVGTRLRRHPD